MDDTNPDGPAAVAQVPVSNHTIKAQPEDTSKPSAAENSKSAPMCRFFSRGICRNGDACRFRHVANAGHSEDRVCRFYQWGRCRYGDSCWFRHIKPQAESEEEEEEEEEGEWGTIWLMRWLGVLEEMSDQVNQFSQYWGLSEERVNEMFGDILNGDFLNSDKSDLDTSSSSSGSHVDAHLPKLGGTLMKCLRVVDALQLATNHGVYTPANWKAGERVIIPPSVSDEEAKKKFPHGFETIDLPSSKKYIRLTTI
ncbi:hypothetical protein KI387_015562 [Taxus chinensis]|uniref:thioredoxin-dependent peroxiredoxin n=1 Tax=Taxus chinensis TaxID=29808 RepID=A0AA38GG60_TAXCH|nr:hypothetical protein KI387_015562 [Taxus chinensis]